MPAPLYEIGATTGAAGFIIILLREIFAFINKQRKPEESEGRKDEPHRNDEIRREKDSLQRELNAIRDTVSREKDSLQKEMGLLKETVGGLKIMVEMLQNEVVILREARHKLSNDITELMGSIELLRSGFHRPGSR